MIGRWNPARRLPLVLLLLLPGACGGTSSSPARPNVILLVWDCARADRCSLDGYGRDTTPVLSRVAREGVTFRSAWSPAGWTAPAHASMFTGLLPENHGLQLGNRMYLDPDLKTLAQRLSAAGYRTCCLTNNVWISPETGLAAGFLHYDSITNRPDAEYPTCRWEHREGLRFARRAHADAVPFFLFLNEMEAHLPFTPLAGPQARFVPEDATPEDLERARRFDTPDAMNHIAGRLDVSPEMTGLLSDLYDAEMAGMDAELATFVDGLAESGILDDTVLIITGDHGENLGDHGLFSHKVSLNRSICRVPLVIRFPGAFEGGRQVEDVVRLEDLFPTILELCGVPVPDGIDGEALTRDLPGRISRGAWGIAGGNLEVPEAPEGADLTPFTSSIRSVFDGRHHLLTWTDGRVELYDLTVDPEERTNLAASRPDLVEELSRRITSR